ncbi:MAG TPA: tetratricopeptide repeat protein, partial [Ignavibacteriaceae bacterium]|nr:tetratricopeptide repeat protein [Ignavibacteriaceae bacterium]
YVESTRRDFKSALKDYNSSIVLNPNNEKAYVNRGNTKGELQDYPGAIEDYTKAIELNPKDSNAYLIRGFDFALLGGFDYAIEDFTKVIEIDSTNKDAYYFRGDAFRVVNKYDSALNDFSKIIELYPDESKAYFKRGMTMIDKGEKKGACPDLERAGKMGYFDAYAAIEKYCKKTNQPKFHKQIDKKHPQKSVKPPAEKAKVKK